MHLWTDYEGRTVDEHYTLGKLLRSEGRNGFFATADKDGHPAVIRLTEAHYDEAELLQRWRQIAGMHETSLIEIEQVGQTTLEGVALTYALMEPDDANLGDVLRERPLTAAETLQVGKAVLAALRALHASGLVHEHVEASNVLAVGETVKLRSDCVRACVADGEFATEEACAGLRRKDLHDFGTLLLRCLTLESEWSPAHNNLPDPFKRIIPRALDGSWSLDQLGMALDPAAYAPKAAPRPAYLAQAQTVPLVEPSAPEMACGPAEAAAGRVHTAAEGTMRGNPGAGLPDTAGVLPTRRFTTDPAETELPGRSWAPSEDAGAANGPSRTVWAGVAVAVVLLLLLGWHFFSGKPATTAARQAAPAAVPGSAASAGGRAAVPVPSAAAPRPSEAADTASAEGAHAAGAPGWYVIAYTYNHEGQAAAKVARLRRVHDSLHPEVFTATGHAPFLVALGGAMGSQDEAEAVYRHARRAGLPRDTFVRHY